MLWADNKSITLQIVFPEKAFKKHISSHFHFFKGDVQALLFFFLLSCTVLLNVGRLQLELKVQKDLLP